MPNCIGAGSPDHHLEEAVVMGRSWVRMASVVYGGIVFLLVFGREQMYETVQSDTGHDVDEETAEVSRWVMVYGQCTYLTTLSMLWKTREFRHMMIATALFPMQRQYVAMKSRFEWGKTQIVRTMRMLTK